MGIGERLKEERERLGFSQTEFAAVAGASKNSQYNCEKGERCPDAAYLAAVAEKGVDILYVVTGVPTPQVVDGSTAADNGEVRLSDISKSKDSQAIEVVVVTKSLTHDERILLTLYREMSELDRRYIRRVAEVISGRRVRGEGQVINLI